MSNPTPETITEAIRNVNLATFGPSAADYGVPTFTDQAQADRFVALEVAISAQHETRNGVAWVAAVTDTDGATSITFRAEQDGRGGCNFYDTGHGATEAFARDIFPGDPEALDTLIAARELFGIAPKIEATPAESSSTPDATPAEETNHTEPEEADTVSTTDTYIATETPKGRRFHKATCKKVNPANVTGPVTIVRGTIEPATCCKPSKLKMYQQRQAADAALDAAEHAAADAATITPEPAQVPAEAPKARRTNKTPATVTYYVNGKPRIAKTSPKPYTLSDIASEALGGPGATGRVREALAGIGVTDPEHTEWELPLPNGKVIAAKVAA